jgi:hypothetical protein
MAAERRDRVRDDRDSVRLPLCTLVQLFDDGEDGYELWLISELGQKIIAPVTGDLIKSLYDALLVNPPSRK